MAWIIQAITLNNILINTFRLYIMTQKTTNELLCEIFEELKYRPDYLGKIEKKVAIISTPRCGSSMFCDVLKKTNKVGDPKEWINIRYIQAYAKVFSNNNINLTEYISFIQRKTTTSNGVFSINFHIEQFIQMLEYKFNPLDLIFDQIYYLQRLDKINQAFSLAKARITDQWSAEAKASKPIDKKIPRKSILESLLYLSNQEDYYSEVLAPHVNRTFTYEEFSQLNTSDAYEQVMKDLDINDYQPNWKTSLKKQRTATSESEINDLKNYLFQSL